ncbi:MAG: transporter, family, multidrug resistance protein, partial [Kribbellaceae bacterium]|nr:transporter, family, multidrug resistance protein [Kribbellaceae bacterium]
MSASELTGHDVGPKAGRKQWIALGVLALPLLLVSMDVSVLYFAVPYISADLGVSATQQLWIFDIYGFVLAGLLITMGSLGDRIGRRRLLIFGAIAFGLASVAAAYAQTPEQLIAARAVLGIGGATLMPSTLALIRNMFHDPAQRGKAIAFWSAVMLGGISLGPVLSGVLLEHFWWGSVFLINTPAMLLLLVLAPLLLPEFKAAVKGRFDFFSSVLSLAAVLPVIWGIKEMAAHGVDTLPIVAIGAGLLVGYVFLRRQRTAEHSMIELAMFRNRAFSGA